MAAPFNVPINKSFGTYVTDGVRSGPFYNDITTINPYNALNPVNNAPVVANLYNQLGKGVLMSPINTYRIVPYEKSSTGVVSTQSVLVGGWLTLGGVSNSDCTLLSPGAQVSFANITPANTPQNLSSENIYVANAGSTVAYSPVFPEGAPSNSFIQFDWPRVVSLFISGGNLVSPTNVTIFGFDFYGYPMQQTYVVQNEGVYPIPLYGSDIKPKAFYGVTAVYFRGVTPPGVTISLGTSNTFGLPFAVDNWNKVLNVTCGSVNLMDLYGTAKLAAGTVNVQHPAISAINDTNPYAQLSNVLVSNALAEGTAGFLTVSAYIANNVTPGADGGFTVTSSNNADTSWISFFKPQGGQYLFQAADASTATGTTGDVRGLFQLSDSGEWSPSLSAGDVEFIFTAYIKGADQQINQNAAGYQSQGYLIDPPAPTNTIPGQVAPLSITDLFGVKQYYTGVPA